MSRACSFCSKPLQHHQKIFKSEDGKLSHLRCIHQRLERLRNHGLAESILQRVRDSFLAPVTDKPTKIERKKPWWKKWKE